MDSGGGLRGASRSFFWFPKMEGFGMKIDSVYLPLYFVDGLNQATLAAVRNSAAADVVSDLTVTEFQQRVAREVLPDGPNGQGGLLFAVTPDDTLCEGFGFFPDRQAWTQTAAGVSVGLTNDQEIDPDTLLRFHPVKCQTERVRMANGTVWDCPVLRNPVFQHSEFGEVYDPLPENHSTDLPQSHYQEFVDGEMVWRREVDERYKKLFEDSRQWFSWLMGNLIAGEQPNFGYPELFQYAVEVLSLRYRYTLHLHNAVRTMFLRSEEVQRVIAVSCGYALAMDCVQKKTGQPIKES